MTTRTVPADRAPVLTPLTDVDRALVEALTRALVRELRPAAAVLNKAHGADDADDIADADRA